MKEAQTVDRTEWFKAMGVYSLESMYELWDDFHQFFHTPLR